MTRLLSISVWAVVLAIMLISPLRAENRPKVGAALYLTSDVAPQSQAFLEGLQIGFEKEGIADLIVENVLTPKDSVTAMTKFIAIDHVVATVVNGQPDAMVVAPLAERSKVPTVVLWDANEDIDKAGEYTFSLGLWTKYSGEVAAQFANNELKARTAAIIAPEDVWAATVAAAFREEFVRNGGTVVYEASISPQETSYLEILARIRATKPAVIYDSIYNNTPAFFQRMRQGGVSAPIITADVLSEDFISKTPQIFENSYQTAVPHPNGPAFGALQTLYRDRHKKEMSLPWFVAVGFDTATLLSHAIKSVGADSVKITQWLYTVKDFAGASSNITISAAGSSPQRPEMYRVKAGKLVSVR
jgi:branched-chain amino acid transport system substrate-binding protein